MEPIVRIDDILRQAHDAAQRPDLLPECPYPPDSSAGQLFAHFLGMEQGLRAEVATWAQTTAKKIAVLMTPQPPQPPKTLAAAAVRHDHASARKTLTLHLIDLPTGGVMVSTNLPTPHTGQPASAAQALAADLLAMCGPRARVWHYGNDDPAYALAAELISPDGYGYAVPPEVHQAARSVLGLAPLPTPSKNHPQPQQEPSA